VEFQEDTEEQQKISLLATPAAVSDTANDPSFLHNIIRSQSLNQHPFIMHFYPVSDTSGDGVLFSIDIFVSFFLSFFVLLARLRENGWTDLHEISREDAQ